MFHRINESMELGMHPAIPYPRRSQNRPPGWTACRSSVNRRSIVRSQPPGSKHPTPDRTMRAEPSQTAGQRRRTRRRTGGRAARGHGSSGKIDKRSFRSPTRLSRMRRRRRGFGGLPTGGGFITLCGAGRTADGGGAGLHVFMGASGRREPQKLERLGLALASPLDASRFRGSHARPHPRRERRGPACVTL